MMPRENRTFSGTGIYHIMGRGNEKKNIFLDPEDKIKFVEILRNKKKQQEYILYGYCIMNNHFHLLIKEEKDSISRIMKRINTSYACYFNKKYDRVGHVFQDRYRSEAVENEGYLLGVLRYIHNNPVKAGLVSTPLDYQWCSFNQYIKQKDDLVECNEILKIFSQDKNKSIKLFEEYSYAKNEDTFIDTNDEDAEKLQIQRLVEHFIDAKRKTIIEIKADKKLRDDLIKKLKKDTNASIRKIAEELRINRNIVQRVK